MISSIGVLSDTPALFIKMSIWNFPVLGCAKWFFEVVMMWVGPSGLETSACTTRQETPYSAEREDESSEVREAEESEV